MVNLGGEKMSKSTGHIIGLREAIETFGGTAVRLFYLRAHYRSPLEFSDDLLEDAGASLDRIARVLERSESGGSPDPTVMGRFVEKMDDDFATPEALSVLFDAVRDANRALDAGEDATGVVGGGPRDRRRARSPSAPAAIGLTIWPMRSMSWPAPSGRRPAEPRGHAGDAVRAAATARSERDFATVRCDS
jgi:hypothetical protein